MHKASLALAAILLAALLPGCTAPRAPDAGTPDEKAVMATIHSFVSGFNAGDTAKAMAACTDEMSIIDEFPPHEWHGAGATARWLLDYAADAAKHDITDGVVTIDAPRHLDVAGDFAYVVTTADYAFERKGEPTRETGSVFTFALHKVAAGWRITGWCWSKD